MTFLTDLTEVLQNSNNALAGVFLRNHAKEIAALVEAAEVVCKCYINDPVADDELSEALAALNKKQ